MFSVSPVDVTYPGIRKCKPVFNVFVEVLVLVVVVVYVVVVLVDVVVFPYQLAPGCVMPGAGALDAAVANAANREDAPIVLGKPGVHMLDLIVQEHTGVDVKRYERRMSDGRRGLSYE